MSFDGWNFIRYLITIAIVTIFKLYRLLEKCVFKNKNHSAEYLKGCTVLMVCERRRWTGEKKTPRHTFWPLISTTLNFFLQLFMCNEINRGKRTWIICTKMLPSVWSIGANRYSHLPLYAYFAFLIQMYCLPFSKAAETKLRNTFWPSDRSDSSDYSKFTLNEFFNE